MGGGVLAAPAAIRDETPGGTRRPAGMPGLKTAAAKAHPPKKVRKRREQQFIRRRMEPTAQGVYVVA